MSHTEHEQLAAGLVPRVAILTLSDSRTPATDTSGQAIARLLHDASATVVAQHLIKDDPISLRATLLAWLANAQIDLIITTGGTGISARDSTFETIESIIERPLPGFGEIFRTLSYEQIGASAMLSRATAGVAGGKAIFALPGSVAAVELAVSKLIIPTMKHLLRELRR